MKNILLNLTYVVTLFSMLLAGCKKDDKNVELPPEPVDEREVITTLQLTFTDTNAKSTAPIVAEFNDPDGDGGKPADRFDTIKLKPGKAYLTKITLLDRTKTPVDTVSNEVAEKGYEHQLFFHTGGASIAIQYLDKDKNNLPIGLLSLWQTGAATIGTGNTTQVVLRHQPGVKNGTEAPGESDVDIKFPTVIR
jgi:hypothetical protein